MTSVRSLECSADTTGLEFELLETLTLLAEWLGLTELSGRLMSEDVLETGLELRALS